MARSGHLNRATVHNFFLGAMFLITAWKTVCCDFTALSEADTESQILDQQIKALDDFVRAQMSMKQPPNIPINRTGFPDMHIITQLYETAGDELKAEGICTACQVGMGLLMHMARMTKIPLRDFQGVTIFVCKLFKMAVPEVCSGIIERYAPTFYFIFKERHFLSSKTFCGIMLQSYGCTTHDPQVEWTVGIPAQYKGKLKEVNAILDNRIQRNHGIDNTGRIKIIQLSDLHIDPLYESGANAECDNNILCCQGSQGRPLNKSLQAGQFGDPRKCDTPYSTLDLALEHISQEHPDAKLFYMNGDIVPHNIWSTTREDNTKIIQNTAASILKYFPTATIVPVLGNHETHPVNFYSPLGVPDEVSTRWIYNTTYDAFQKWIPANQADQYRKAGFYTVDVDEKFRLLVLNSNFCYGFNVWQTYEFGDTEGHLAWLIAQLQLAETQNRTVHIVGHVPPGHEECSRVWSRNFYQIMLRFHHIIKGQFYGHTHYGEFRLLYDQQQRPINVLWIAPSLTPYEVHNMAYRVYYADPKDYQIMDYETWMFDLKAANLHPEEKPKWFSVYSGTAEFGIPDATPQNMNVFVNKMATDEEAFHQYYQHYHKILDAKGRKTCSTRCRKRILCGIVRSYSGEQLNCIRIQMKIDGIVLPVNTLLNRG